jgi:protocatechuate 3,4-dioxygenase beta subunit
MAGTRLTLTGVVLGTDCRPLPGAVLDFWQASAGGVYDNRGYSLRGHQPADAAGRYTLETVIPGLYPGRTEHIHVKVQPAGGQVLTTQLFFPGVTQNERDGIFDPALLMAMTDAPGGGKLATFTFVIAAS